MIYLIGGPARVGKTTLVNRLVERHPMHAVSTDAIRYMLRRAVPQEALHPDIFRHFGTDVMSLWEHDPTMAIDEQNRESKALWPAITQFIHSYDEDGVDLVVEGVAILPEFAHGLDVANKSLFLGNTSEAHLQTIMQQAELNDHDWMHSLDQGQIIKAAGFFAMFSDYIKAEASKFDLRYLEIDDASYDDSLAQAANYLLPG